MTTTKLTFEDAVSCWLMRAEGAVKRDIWAHFRVDPRRVYEVWEGNEHQRSREAAIAVFQGKYPGKSLDGLFELHVPKLRVVSLDAQLTLFGQA